MPPTDPRIVKRYANRKLYDTRDSRYVTLDHIAEMIRRGEDVKVVDNRTGDDLTSVTLAQIIFENEKRAKTFLPLSLLRRIVQSGGESFEQFKAQIAESPVARVFRREGSGAEPPPRAEAADPPEAAGRRDEGERVDPVGRLRELLESSQHALDQWQRRLEASLQSAVDTVSPLAPLHRELRTLRERMAEIEEKLGAIEAAGGRQ